MCHAFRNVQRDYDDDFEEDDEMSQFSWGAVGDFFTNFGIDYMIQDVSGAFDCRFYWTKYPDLERAFGRDCTKLRRHYYRHGIGEGRKSSGDFFCPVYLRKNQDLRRAFGYNCAAAKEHYYNHGIREGRNGGSYHNKEDVEWLKTFDCKAYADRYADLKQSFGYNCDQLTNHWVQYGFDQGRNGKK